MSSMEVDLPQHINGTFSSYPAGNGSNNTNALTSPLATTVQFNAITEVKTFAPTAPPTSAANGDSQQRPKHKARRRARLPKIDTSGATGNGSLASPTLQGKPLSPSKLKKLADKDRHSRTGRRGMPKKG